MCNFYITLLKLLRKQLHLQQVLHIRGGVGEGFTSSALGALLEQLEGALLGDVAQLAQILDGFTASGLLATADDTSALGFDQILLGQTTGSVLGGSVEHFGLGAQGLEFGATHHGGIVFAGTAAVLARCTTSRGHFVSIVERIKNQTRVGCLKLEITLLTIPCDIKFAPGA